MDGVVEVFVWINEQKRIEVVLRKRASALRVRTAVFQTNNTTLSITPSPNGRLASYSRRRLPVCTRAAGALGWAASARARPQSLSSERLSKLASLWRLLAVLAGNQLGVRGTCSGGHVSRFRVYPIQHDGARSLVHNYAIQRLPVLCCRERPGW